MAILTAHAGSFVSSAISSLIEAPDSLDWAKTDSAEMNKAATVKRRIMETCDQSPGALA